MITASNVLLILAGLATALMAGLFYSYSCSVNPGLSRLGDAEYLTAMQSINRAILNPVFFSAFFGALILLPLSTYVHYDPSSARFWLLLAATLIYAVGLFGVTIAFNVPLNEMLEGFSIQGSTIAEVHQMRKDFEGPWNNYHFIRTVAVITSLLLFLLAIVFE